MTDPRKVVAHVAERFGYTPEDLTGRGRSTGLSWARQVCYRVLQDVCSMSSVGVGSLLGGRDHTTVLAGLRVVAEREEREPWVETMIRQLITECQAA